jgi:hypothetical protein
MPKVVITHAVQDIDRWLQGKAERAAAIESAGGSNVTDYIAQDGRKNIAVTADVADVELVKSMAGAPPPEVAALMEKHGVVQPVTIYIEPGPASGSGTAEAVAPGEARLRNLVSGA